MTRDEPGCLWFEWSRSAENPSEWVLVEAFRDRQADVLDGNSDRFRAGLAAMRSASGHRRSARQPGSYAGRTAPANKRPPVMGVSGATVIHALGERQAVVIAPARS